MNKRCVGCGVLLQSDEKDKKGFIPKNKKEEGNYCERCFKIMHYNQKLILPLENGNDYVLKEIHKKKYPVFFLLDFLSINEETISTFKKIQNPKTFIISKLDLIPKSIKKERICTWLQKEYGIKEEIQFISTKKNLYTKYITNKMKERNMKKAYILGYTNSGKSTLINALCTSYKTGNQKITTSLLPNTTMDFIHIKLDDSLTIIDSPGFTYKETLYKEKEFDLIEKLNPKHFLKPITYQVKPISSILIENKIRLQTNQENSLTFYMSNDLVMKRVFEKNQELLALKKEEYNVKKDQDIVMKGLGFIHIKKACTLTLYIENDELIEIRNSMFGEE